MLLSACSSVKAPDSKAATAAVQNTADNNTDNDTAIDTEDDKQSLPKVELSPEIFYGIVTSEIAAQRGGVGPAAATYLELAQQTRDPRLAQRAAELALFSGQLKDASEALQLWLSIEPNSKPAREQLVFTLLRSGQLKASQPLIESLLKDDPAKAGAVFVQLARLTSLLPDKQGNFNLVNSLAQNYPSLPEARFAVMAAAAETGNDAVVYRELDTLAQIAPNWDLPVAWQADRLRKQDLGQAANFIKKELDRRPHAGLELKVAYPRLLVGAKRFPEARAAFEALLAQYPDNADLLYGTGLLDYQLQDLAAADKHLQAALKANHPEADIIRYSLGQIAEDRKDPASARKWYESVVPGSQYLMAQGRLAIMEAEAGETERAIERLKPLGKSQKEREQVVLLQSQIARTGKHYTEAYELLTQALHDYPKSADLLYERALVADSLNKITDAERDLKAVLKQRNTDVQALNALGYTLANRTTRYQEALGYIDKALKGEPDNPMIQDSMGWVLFKLGRYDNALAYLQKSYSALPDPEVAAHLGEVLWKMGRQDDARKIWGSALKSSPEHDVLTQTMRRYIKP